MDSTLIERYIELGRRFATYITDVSMEINEALDEGKHVMAEAAQGTHLDIHYTWNPKIRNLFLYNHGLCLCQPWSRPYKSGQCDSYS